MEPVALEQGCAEDLVRRIQEGQPEAACELVELFRPAVLRVLAAARLDASAADDVHQETFRIALVKIRDGRLREPGGLPAFVVCLARKLAVEHFRRLRAHRVTGGTERDPRDPAADPLEDVLRSERAGLVRRVLSEMTSARDREVLYRFYIAGDDKGAICRDLGLTGVHFNRVLFRARVRYRELYLATVT